MDARVDAWVTMCTRMGDHPPDGRRLSPGSCPCCYRLLLRTTGGPPSLRLMCSMCQCGRKLEGPCM